jgi:alpha-galactosidase
MYHASLIFSTGGLLLSGDDLTTISAERLAILKKMLPPSGAVASYNKSLDIGWMKKGQTTYLILLNKEDKGKKFSVPLSQPYVISNYWTGEKKGTYDKQFDAEELPAHSGRVYKLVTIGNRLKK